MSWLKKPFDFYWGLPSLGKPYDLKTKTPKTGAASQRVEFIPIQKLTYQFL